MTASESALKRYVNGQDQNTQQYLLETIGTDGISVVNTILSDLWEEQQARIVFLIKTLDHFSISRDDFFKFFIKTYGNRFGNIYRLSIAEALERIK